MQGRHPTIWSASLAKELLDSQVMASKTPVNSWTTCLIWSTRTSTELLKSLTLNCQIQTTSQMKSSARCSGMASWHVTRALLWTSCTDSWKAQCSVLSAGTILSVLIPSWLSVFPFLVLKVSELALYRLKWLTTINELSTRFSNLKSAQTSKLQTSRGWCLIKLVRLEVEFITPTTSRWASSSGVKWLKSSLTPTKLIESISPPASSSLASSKLRWTTTPCLKTISWRSSTSQSAQSKRERLNSNL